MNWTGVSNKKVIHSNRNTVLIVWQGQWSESVLTLQSKVSHLFIYFFKRNGHCSNKLKKRNLIFVLAGPSRPYLKGCVAAFPDKYHQKRRNIREEEEKEIDVISGAALDQYLITGTEERLACVRVCTCLCVHVRGTRQGAGRGLRLGVARGGVKGNGIRCHICHCALIVQMCPCASAQRLQLSLPFYTRFLTNYPPNKSIACYSVCESERLANGFKHKRNQ